MFKVNRLRKQGPCRREFFRSNDFRDKVQLVESGSSGDPKSSPMQQLEKNLEDNKKHKSLGEIYAKIERAGESSKMGTKWIITWTKS